MSTKVTVNTETNKVIINSEPAKVVTVNTGADAKVVKVITQGPKGDKGDSGELSKNLSGSYTLTGSLLISTSFNLIGNATITGSLKMGGPIDMNGQTIFASRIDGTPNGVTELHYSQSGVHGNVGIFSEHAYITFISASDYNDFRVFVDKISTSKGIEAQSFTGSLFGSASYSETASYVFETDPVFVSISGSLATTGSNLFIGSQQLYGDGSNPVVLKITQADNSNYAFGLINETYNPNQLLLGAWAWNDGRVILGTEEDKALEIYNHANWYNPTIIISSSGVTFYKPIEGLVGITGSLLGTSSWAINAVNADTASNIEYVNISNLPTLFSGSSQVELNQISGNTFADTLYTFPGDVVVQGNVTAEQLIISSSVIFVTTSFSSGSTIFGNSIDDTHQFTGSLRVNGSITGSLFGTASFANNSSNSATASYVLASGVVGLNLDRITTGSVTASVSLGTASFQIVSSSTTFLFVSNSGFIGVNRTIPAYSLDISGSVRIGAAVDTTTQGELLRLSVGSSAAASSYIGFQRANATYASYNLGYIGTNKFGFWRTGDVDSLFGFNSSTTQLVSVNFGLPNGTINAQTDFYFSSSSQYTAPIRLFNNTTAAQGVYLPFITVNTVGTTYEYAKVTGIKPSVFSGTSVVGGLQFSIKSGSDSWINPFDITFDSKFLMTGSLSLSGSVHSIIGQTTINNLTGSLFGTASWATNSLTASYVPSTGIFGDVRRIATGSITASVNVAGDTFRIISGSSTFLYVSSSGNIAVNHTNAAYNLDVSGSRRGFEGSSYEVERHGTFTIAENPTGSYTEFAVIGTTTVSAGFIDLTLLESNIGHSSIKYFIPFNYDDPNPTPAVVLPLYSTNPRNTPSGQYGGAVHKLQISSSASGRVLRLVTFASGSGGTNTWYWTAKLKNCDITSTPNTTGVDDVSYSIYEKTQITHVSNGTSAASIAIGKDTANAKLDVNGNVIVTGSLTTTSNTSVGGNLGVGKTASNVRLDVNGNSVITGSLIVTAGVTANLTGTASWATNALTASFLNNLNQNLGVTGSIRLSGSATTELFVLGDQEITGSLSVTNRIIAQSFTGSVFGTSSWAQNAVTASYITGSIFSGGNSVLSASYAVSASNSQTASYVEYTNVANKPTLFSGSSQVQLNQISGTTFADALYTFPGDLVVQGNVTAEQLIISSSVIFVTTSFSSGSTIFGNSLDDTHRFTGSVFISNSLQVTGSFSVTSGINAQSITSSFSGSLTGALIGTASWAQNAVTASSVGNLNQNLSITGSVRLSGSVGTELFVLGDQEITGSLKITNGVIAQSFTGSLFGTSSWAQNSLTASYVLASSVAGLTLSQISSGSVTASVNINSASFQIVSASNRLLFVSNSGVTIVPQILVSGSGVDRLTVVGSGSSSPIFTVVGSQGELFSVSDSLSGSLFSVNDISGLPVIEAFSDNRVLMGSYQAPVLFTTVRTNTVSGNNIIYSIPTASYDGAFFEYTIKSGSNSRAGQVMSLWSGSEVNFTEVVTMDFGTTSNVKFVVQVTGSSLILTGSFPTANWTMKTIVRSI